MLRGGKRIYKNITRFPYPIRDNIQIGGKPTDDIYRFTKSTRPRHSKEKIESPTRREVVLQNTVNGMPPEQGLSTCFSYKQF